MVIVMSICKYEDVAICNRCKSSKADTVIHIEFMSCGDVVYTLRLFICNILYIPPVSAMTANKAYVTKAGTVMELLDVVEVDVVSTLGASLFLSTDAEDETTGFTVVEVVEPVEGSILGLGVVSN